MKKVLRTILVVFLETITIPIKVVIVICALVKGIYARIEYDLTFKEQWCACLEGMREAIELNKKFINTGKYY